MLHSPVGAGILPGEQGVGCWVAGTPHPGWGWQEQGVYPLERSRGLWPVREGRLKEVKGSERTQAG